MYLDELRLQAQPARRKALQARIHALAEETLENGREQSPLEPGRDRPVQELKTGWRWSVILVRIAAVALIAILWQPLSDVLRDQRSAESGEFVTAANERMELTLEDGTTVTLGGNSRLSLVANPQGQQRELRLEGFALLDVAPDSSRPFVIHTASMTTRVLGTRFVIRAYSEEDTVAVAVAEGKVAVVPDMAGGAGVFLTRGQVGRMGVDGMLEVEQDELEVGRLVRSAHGPLDYTDIPLDEVLDELEGLYPVVFAVQDSSIATQLLTLRLSGDRLENVLSAIALAVGARYEQVGDTVTFHAL